MSQRPLYFAFALLLVCLAVISITAQTKPKPIELSIAIDSVTIDPHHQIKVHARIANHTGRSFKRDVVTFEFHLEKKFGEFENCTSGDCFSTSTFSLKKFENDGTYQFTVDLTKFYWNDSISCSADLSRPSNMPKVILPDEYSLFLDYWIDLPANKHQQAFHVEGRSNVIAVKLERRK